MFDGFLSCRMFVGSETFFHSVWPRLASKLLSAFWKKGEILNYIIQIIIYKVSSDAFGGTLIYFSLLEEP